MSGRVTFPSPKNIFLSKFHVMMVTILGITHDDSPSEILDTNDLFLGLILTDI